MTSLLDEFTSTGKKFWHHPEALTALQEGKPKPVVSHIMPTDICQHKCSFCSVQTREGDTLELSQIRGYVDQLLPLGLKAIIISGGGNPILYKKFDELIDFLHSNNLKIGLITNGMPLRDDNGRKTWFNVAAQTLDKLAWVRISMSGFDHAENQVFVPEIDREKTTLGFSYVYHDTYVVPEEPHHGKVSTVADLIQLGLIATNVIRCHDRFQELAVKISEIVKLHKPKYVRLLPNCLEESLISSRCAELQEMANLIDPKVVFVQYKPPEAPPACYLGYLHPVLNTDGFVYPCDSCVLNKAAGHKFAEPWRMCRWDEIGEFYNKPRHSLVDSKKLCPGCVFTKSNQLLGRIVEGVPLLSPEPVEHPDFI